MMFSFKSKYGQHGEPKKDYQSSSSSKTAQTRKTPLSPMESVRAWVRKIGGFFRTKGESASQDQRGNYHSQSGNYSTSADLRTSSFPQTSKAEPKKAAEKAPIRIESVLEYWITLEFFKELDANDADSYNPDYLLKRIFNKPKGTKFRLFLGSIRKYDLLLPIYQEHDWFLEETKDRTPLFQVDIELVEKKQNSAPIQKMIRFTKDSFIFSPWVFAMSPRSINKLKASCQSDDKVYSLFDHYDRILLSVNQELSEYYEEVEEEEENEKEKEEIIAKINQLSKEELLKKKAAEFTKQQDQGKGKDTKEEEDPLEPFLSLYNKLSDEIGTLKDGRKVEIAVDQIKLQVLSEKNTDSLTNRSFYRKDLLRVMKDLGNMRDNSPIKAYLRTACGEYTTYSRWYTENNLSKLFSWAPQVRWPSPFSPALMQQVAINLGSELGEIEEPSTNKDNYANVFSVNGPPGTGKTTLLKDIIASYVAQRAHKLVDAKPGFDDVFKDKPIMVTCKDGNNESQIPVYLFEEPEDYRKYGILVCSSNNAAVENLSKELPDLDNLDAEYAEESNCLSSDYYRDYATNLLQKLKNNEVSNAWGLIAVPLGKYENLTAFLTECLSPINAQEQQDYEETVRRQFEEYRRNNENWQYVFELFAKLGIEYDFDDQFYNPFDDQELNLRRSQLFVSSLEMIRCFNETHYMRSNLKALEMLFRRNLRFDGMTDLDRSLVIQTLWDSLFFLVPVISSTFASIQTMLADIGAGGIGTLIIDEAGQAPPHAAAGALWRAQRAIVVGDPKQVEPVVTVDDAVAAYFRINLNLKDAPFLGKNSSVQVIADHMHPYGDYLGEEKPENWVGCPLRVHRRCINPMFQISNQTSYGGSMVLGGSDGIPEEDIPKYLLKSSCWIDVAGQSPAGKGSHYIIEQGDVAMLLIKKWMQKWADIPIEERQGLYVISPFKSVVNDLKSNLRRSVPNNPSMSRWIDSCIGTVHTFQGKEAAEVIFLLGCTQRAKGAVQWVNPNILNVAVTRAKKRVYFIGKWDVWNKNAVFKESVLFGHWGNDGTDLIRIPEHALDNYWSDVIIPEEPPHETYPLLKNLSERTFLRIFSQGQEGSFYVGCLQRGWIFEVRQDPYFREAIPDEQIRSFTCYGSKLYCGLVLPFRPKAEPEEIQKELEITIAFFNKERPYMKQSNGSQPPTQVQVDRAK